LQAILVLRERARQDLDRDVASESTVARPIDLSHASGAEQFLDFVWTEQGSGGQGGRQGFLASLTGSRTCAHQPIMSRPKTKHLLHFREGGATGLRDSLRTTPRPASPRRRPR